MKDNIYQVILTESKDANIKTQNAKTWFRSKALEITKSQIEPLTVIKDKKPIPKINNKTMVGKLFLYNYVPKTRLDLSYYDSFPIVFPFRIVKTGFYGINMHYLPPMYRAILMDAFYKLANSSDLKKDTTRLYKLTYDMIMSKRILKWALPCIKQYLHKQIRSKVAYIPPSEWELALFLPLQRFKKANDTKVWKQSIVTAKKEM
jgi:hypothetical protein